jgi:hypothetical protein
VASERLRQSEIQQLDHALRRDLHIGGFQIAMHDAFVVRVFKGSGTLRSDVPSLIERHGAFGRFALDQWCRCPACDDRMHPDF